MAQDVCVIVGAEDRERLAAVVGDRRRPLKHVQPARIVLASANRLPVAEVARRAGVSRLNTSRSCLLQPADGRTGILFCANALN